MTYICLNPLIENTKENRVIMRILCIEKIAQMDDEVYVVNWPVASISIPSGIGTQRRRKILDWYAEWLKNGTNVEPRCPRCGQVIHENN